MLRRLEINDLALIRQLTVEFEQGLGVITGETGAGKSILLDALGLALGFKASSDLLRKGAESCRIQALFEVDMHDGAWATWLEAKGLGASSDGELWLKRELALNGRGRCWINGESVPLPVLAEAGEALVDFQGQHEHQSLLRTRHHLALLDEFAGSKSLASEVRDAWVSLAQARGAFRDAGLSGEERLKRVDLLDYQVRELEAAAPSPGEREALMAERALGLSAGKRSQALATAYGSLFGAEQEGALSQLDAVGGELRRLAAMDPGWGVDLPRFEASLAEMKDLAAKIDAAKDNADFDPKRAEKIEERLHLIELLCKKYATDEAGLLVHARRAKEELDSLEDHAGGMARHEKLQAAATAAFSALSTRLSEERRAAAGRLVVSVQQELSQLGLDKAVFDVRFGALEGPNGLEEAEFLLAANPGEGLKPLAKVASGGELSRITLALKAVLSKGTQVGTLIFDEIDTGVSGRIADIVGDKLVALAKQRQLICITHLPQIASRPGRHYRVEKTVTAGVTETSVHVLDEKERESEIAAMLDGKEISASALGHARQLLAAARISR